MHPVKKSSSVYEKKKTKNKKHESISQSENSFYSRFAGGGSTRSHNKSLIFASFYHHRIDTMTAVNNDGKGGKGVIVFLMHGPCFRVLFYDLIVNCSSFFKIFHRQIVSSLNDVRNASQSPPIHNPNAFYRFTVVNRGYNHV